MNTTVSGKQPSNQNALMRLIAKYQQQLKGAIYVLLILNWGYYFYDDWRAAQTTITASSGFFTIAAAYATTFDELGWFVILFLLEIETYWMEDDASRGVTYWLMQIVRLCAYVVILHTFVALAGAAIDTSNATVLTDVKGVCALVGEDLSFVRNLLYTPITADNCATLSAGGDIYRFIGEPVVSDKAGYIVEEQHAWLDAMEVLGWLLISSLITITIIIQDRGIYESRLIDIADKLQMVVYLILFGIAIYWSFYEYYVYTWDIMLWIGGFAMIDANLSDWRDELKGEG